MLSGARIDERVDLIRLGLREVCLGCGNGPQLWPIHFRVHRPIQAKHQHPRIPMEVTCRSSQSRQSTWMIEDIPEEEPRWAICVIKIRIGRYGLPVWHLEIQIWEMRKQGHRSHFFIQSTNWVLILCQDCVPVWEIERKSSWSLQPWDFQSCERDSD